MIRLDAATVLLQWSVGGLLFCWVTTRGRLVGIGYGWLLRVVYAVLAIGGIAIAIGATGVVWVREISAAGVVVAAGFSLVVSILRRRAGVSGQHAEADRKRDRVAAMVTPVDRPYAGGAEGNRPTERKAAGDAEEAPLDEAGGTSQDDAATAITMRDAFGRVSPQRGAHGAAAGGAEFPPMLDLIAPAIGVIGLIAGGWDAGGNHALAIARILVGAAFLGCVTDAMLLGHWYLTQPGLPRRPIHELNDWLFRIWPLEVALFLIPTGMISALNGNIHDGWNGLLGWFWVACALGTGILSRVTRAALRERFYSAVMAATGLLYLAILTAFGTDLVARAILR